MQFIFPASARIRRRIGIPTVVVGTGSIPSSAAVHTLIGDRFLDVADRDGHFPRPGSLTREQIVESTSQPARMFHNPEVLEQPARGVPGGSYRSASVNIGLI